MRCVEPILRAIRPLQILVQDRRAPWFDSPTGWLFVSPPSKQVRTAAHTEKFQQLADAARARVVEVCADQVDALVAAGALPLAIRDKEEHDVDHIAGSLPVRRGKLKMNAEGVIPDLDTFILCYRNAYNRGALCADTLRVMGYRNARFIAGGLKGARALR
jgi:rhodanese-related sulfurtransferase